MLLFILYNKSQHYGSRCPVIWVNVTTVTLEAPTRFSEVICTQLSDYRDLRTEYRTTQEPVISVSDEL